STNSTSTSFRCCSAAVLGSSRISATPRSRSSRSGRSTPPASPTSSTGCRQPRTPRRRGSTLPPGGRCESRPGGLTVDESWLLILGLCVALPTLSVIARLLDVPYPIVLVLGAIPLGYLPGAPDVELDPDLVLVIFLPPLLYVAAFMADLRALRADARALSLTSIGLVLVTTCV